MQQYSDAILNKVSAYIESNRLIPHDNSQPQTIIVGLSGGADSIALTHILWKLGYHLISTHCHFGLRGKEADRDLEFSRNFAGQLNIEFHEVHFKTKEYQENHGLSTEMACRELRYNWWNENFLAQNPNSLLAVGHHQDDNIETLLINLMRGTGIRGLLGIPSSNGQIIRPLLCLTKEDILFYIEDNQLSYITDSTNLENDFVRNRVRNQLIPLMTQILPQAKKGIADTINNLHDSALFTAEGVDNLVSKHCKTFASDEIIMHCLNKEAFINDKIKGDKQKAAIIFEFFKQFDCIFNNQTINQILQCISIDNNNKYFKTASAACFILKNQILVTKDSRLWDECRRNMDQISINLIQSDSESQLTTTGFIPNNISMNLLSYQGISISDIKKATNNTESNESISSVFIDINSVAFPLTLRRWTKGDKIKPLGMNRHKLVSDLFSNQHYSLVQKLLTWVLCDNNDNVLWVSGCRSSEEGKVSDRTKNMLRIAIKSVLI